MEGILENEEWHYDESLARCSDHKFDSNDLVDKGPA